MYVHVHIVCIYIHVGTQQDGTTTGLEHDSGVVCILALGITEEGREREGRDRQADHTKNGLCEAACREA